MHLELIHVSHCCRTWREMSLPASEHMCPALLLLPSLGRSSTAFTTIIYCEGINNCSLGKRHPLLNWIQSPEHLQGTNPLWLFRGWSEKPALCPWWQLQSELALPKLQQAALRASWRQSCALPTASAQVQRLSLSFSERGNNGQAMLCSA